MCAQKIDGTREPWDLEHLIPLALDGADDETNTAPAHKSCHRAKTNEDVGRIAKANRVRAKHNGAKKQTFHRLAGSRGTKFKKRIDGTVVRRDEA